MVETWIFAKKGCSKSKELCYKETKQKKASNGLWNARIVHGLRGHVAPLNSTELPCFPLYFSYTSEKTLSLFFNLLPFTSLEARLGSA